MQFALIPQTPTIVPRPSALPIPLTPAIDAVAPLILFGLDQRGRPHAASLDGYAVSVVERAADQSDYFCVAADTDALCDLAAELAAGRIFPKSGRALVPFCSRATYDRLLAAAGITPTPKPLKAVGKATEAGGNAGGAQGRGAGGSGAGDPPATRVGIKAPADWSQIGIGSRVLTKDEAEGAYYLAEIVATKADDHFVLRWADYPDLPEFSRARRALALMHPDAVEAVE